MLTWNWGLGKTGCASLLQTFPEKRTVDAHLSRLRVRDLRLRDLRQDRPLLKDRLRDLLTDLEDAELGEEDLERRLLEGLEYERLEDRDALLHHVMFTGCYMVLLDCKTALV
ncbi:hypothetical protein ABBQ38_014880 [Trebouxia sp. C0009 RCD-2024]